MKLTHFVLLILILNAPAFAECTPGGLAVVVNKSNPTDSLSPAQLRRILIGDIRTWSDRKAVILVSREPSSDVGKCMLSEIARMNDAEYRRYLLSVEFRGGEAVSIRTIDSGQAAAKLIAGLPSAMAIIEASSLPQISQTVKPVKINGKLPGEPGYPF